MVVAGRCTVDAGILAGGVLAQTLGELVTYIQIEINIRSCERSMTVERLSKKF
jgi:hypothetical protein